MIACGGMLQPTAGYIAMRDPWGGGRRKEGGIALSSIHSEKGFCCFLMGIFRQADADLDAGKWIPDPFQASTRTLMLHLTLGVNGT